MTDRVTIIDELQTGPTDIAPDHTIPDTLAERCGQKAAFDGITVRDVFAAFALAGYLAAHAGEDIELPKRADVAAYSFRMADEMLKARAG